MSVGRLCYVHNHPHCRWIEAFVFPIMTRSGLMNQTIVVESYDWMSKRKAGFRSQTSSSFDEFLVFLTLNSFSASILLLSTSTWWPNEIGCDHCYRLRAREVLLSGNIKLQTRYQTRSDVHDTRYDVEHWYRCAPFFDVFQLGRRVLVSGWRYSVVEIIIGAHLHQYYM